MACVEKAAKEEIPREMQYAVERGLAAGTSTPLRRRVQLTFTFVCTSIRVGVLRAFADLYGRACI